MAFMGSPPHTRGTPCNFFARPFVTGITPAYAGNTIPAFSIFPSSWDHPRIRGEHCQALGTSRGPMGSPPHTRGTRRVCHAIQHNPRITPAYAGNTGTEPAITTVVRDHPRIRGEHAARASSCSRRWGSPPHTRGTRVSSPSNLTYCRITPAYAGNTNGSFGQRTAPGDHPRIRGEHDPLVDFDLRKEGSPPHTRGTPKQALFQTRPRGITPAYAGNTQLVVGDHRAARDHPRIRGEHLLRFSRNQPSLGSPPHTRGTQQAHDHNVAHAGITPAYAGNTLGLRYWKRFWRDHPRIRGEHAFELLDVANLTGSPPHTRGTQLPSPIAWASVGITPAYAGNTHMQRHHRRRPWDHPRIRGEHMIGYPMTFPP